MPHSSGGGSHGGGSHGGGSHGGSSGNRISNHYFYGSRCFRRHYTDGRREDEYVYATRTPSRTSLGGTIVICIMAVFFLFMSVISVGEDLPHKLKPEYSDRPAVHDEYGLIENTDELTATLKEYCDVTGICPVIYTAFDEDWVYEYASLEDYTYDLYVREYSDEQHFVIVYSIPVSQAVDVLNGKLDVPDYSWEAVQGDETDPIITMTLFRVFADRVQDKLESGEGPGEAFNYAFVRATDDCGSVIKPGGISWLLKLGSSLMPILVIAGIFVPLIIFSIKNYLKYRHAVYEEVPIDHDPESGANYVNVQVPSDGQGISMGAYAGSSAGTGDKGYHASASVEFQKTGTMVASIISFVVMIPFFLAGVGMIIGSVVMISRGIGDGFGYYLLGFGVLWNIILVSVCLSLFKNLRKIKKKEDEPEQVSYPTSEYPQPVYSQPETQNQTQTQSQPEFDQQFFSQQKSNYEDDDEDYKRMKRKGFE